MLIRHFEQSDRDTFFALCKQFYEAEATLRGFDADITARTFGRVMDRHENSWGVLLVDRDSGEAMGYALLTSYWSNEDGGEVLVLDELFIRPIDRQKGYARAFMVWLEDTYRGRVTSITLEVLTTNLSAQILYGKMGYVPDGFTTYTKRIE